MLFGFQSETILHKPQAIVLIAIPLLIQTYGIFAIAYFVAKQLKLPHNVAAPACMMCAQLCAHILTRQGGHPSLQVRFGHLCSNMIRPLQP